MKKSKFNASRAVFPDLVFTPVVGPMVSSTGGNDVSIAVHWKANGTYAGGLSERPYRSAPKSGSAEPMSFA